jgi:hypothetical protein
MKATATASHAAPRIESRACGAVISDHPVQRSDGGSFLVFFCSALISVLMQGILKFPQEWLSLGKIVRSPSL